jgi:hypothetical protein
LHETAVGSLNRITNLALATRGGYLAPGPNNWLTGASGYYFHSTIHSLIAPLAVYELMTRKMTQLDLNLDPDLYRQHFIARYAYRALRSDFDFADADRYLPIAFDAAPRSYNPPELRPPAMPDLLEQRWAWRQGIYSGQISQAVDAVLTQDETGAEGIRARVMTYAEFAKALNGNDLRDGSEAPGLAGEMKLALRPIIEIIQDFHPARRPVTWRILLAQAVCYRAITVAPKGAGTIERIIETAGLAAASNRRDFDWIGDSTRSRPPELSAIIDFGAEHESALETADRYLTGTLMDFSRQYPG